MIWLLGMLVWYGLHGPETGLYIFAFAIPFEFIFFAWGMGRYTMLGYPAIGLLVVWAWSRSEFRTALTLPEWFYLILLVWSGVTLLWAEDLLRGIQVLFTHCGLFAVLYIFSRGLKSYDSMMRCLWYFSGGILLLAAVLSTYYERTTWVYYYEKTYISTLSADEVSPYDLGNAALVAFLGALALWEFERTPLRRRIGLLVAGVFGVCVLLTLGRALTIELALCCLVWVALSGRSTSRLGVLGRIRKIGVAGILVGGVLVAALAVNRGAMEERWVGQTVSLSEDIGALATGRPRIYREGLSMFLDQPLVGVGMGQFSTTYSKLTGNVPKGQHSAIVGFLAETGLFGASLFMALCLALGFAAWKAQPWRNVCVAWWAYFVVQAIVHGYGRNKAFWMAAGLTALLARGFNTQSASQGNPNLMARGRRHKFLS
ncbi:O-antigen ligase family protein [Acidobacteria bacterium AH-259-G07]|nr:O-antigen ligase family protein [Acidobacteria bacterium AH-259-G07]